MQLDGKKFTLFLYSFILINSHLFLLHKKRTQSIKIEFFVKLSQEFLTKRVDKLRKIVNNIGVGRYSQVLSRSYGSSAPYDLNKFNATKSKSNAISSIIIFPIIAALLSFNFSEKCVWRSYACAALRCYYITNIPICLL